MKRAAAQIRAVLFRVNDGWYAVDIMRVAEVIRPAFLSRLPRMPAYVAGSISLRGAMVPVIDLCHRFRQPVAAETNRSRIMLLTLPDQRIGVLVDEVHGVITVRTDEIFPPPHLMAASVAVFLIGVVSSNDRLVAVVNVDRLLTVAEQAVLDIFTQVECESPPEVIPCS